MRVNKDALPMDPHLQREIEEREGKKKKGLMSICAIKIDCREDGFNICDM